MLDRRGSDFPPVTMATRPLRTPRRGEGLGVSPHHQATPRTIRRYLLRAPVAVERMQLDIVTGEVLYQARHASGPGAAVESFAAALSA